MDHVYEPIPEGHIRLITPVRGYHATTSHPNLILKMVTYPIANAPPYTAVSYFWGLGAASHTIYLDGGKFAVRQSLWQCLATLMNLIRWSDGTSQRPIPWKYFWVDAICINQSDVKERNRQVRAMGRVYSKAAAVTAWLGVHPSPLDLQWKQEVFPDIPSTRKWNIYDLADRPYWSRMWVVQELLLAKHITILTIPHTIEFDALVDCAKRDESVYASDLRCILAFDEARESQDLASGLSLVDLLFEFGRCQCQDPRDKVFALMSLLNKDDKDILDGFFPDYSLTHDAVVVIVLSFFKDFYQPVFANKSQEVMDILGVSSAKLARRRLIAAAETFDILEPSARDREFLEIPFIDPEGEDMPTKSRTLAERIRAMVDGAKAVIWWFATCFGVFRARRQLDEQALMDAIINFERQPLLPR